MSLIERSASELLADLQSGALSSEEATRAYLDAIAARDPQIKAFLHVDADSALKQARSIDEKRARGETVGGVCSAGAMD